MQEIPLLETKFDNYIVYRLGIRIISRVRKECYSSQHPQIIRKKQQKVSDNLISL